MKYWKQPKLLSYGEIALALLVLALACTTVRPAPAHAASRLVQLGDDPYTSVSPSLHKTAFEPAAAAFGSTMVTAFQVGRFVDGGSTNIGWASSSDYGQHWRTGFLPSTTIYAGGSHARISDPAVSYDLAHRVWLISALVVDAGTDAEGNTFLYGSAVVVSRSRDGGRTWSAPVTVAAAPSPPAGSFPEVEYDKDWLSCDTSIRSPFFGHCYTLWNDSTETIYLSASTDGGATWGAPQSPADDARGTTGQLVIQPNGTVVVVTPVDDFVNGSYTGAFISTDGGQSWGPTVKAADGAAFFPSIAEDAEGTIYATFAGCPSQGCDSGSNTLLLISSTDGIHWTPPQPALPLSGSAASYDLPALAVDPATAGEHAHLGLTYYVFDCEEAGCTTQPFLISSRDGGKDWSAPQALAVQMSLDWLVPRRGVGDYVAAVFSAGRAFPFIGVGTERGSDDPFNQAIYTVAGGIQP